MAGNGGAVSAEYVCGRGAHLGECPVWDDRAETLHWLDCTAPAVFSLTSGTVEPERAALAEMIGSFALRSEGAGCVAAVETGFAWLDPRDGGLTPIIDPEAGKPENRFNDGGADPGGGFVAGSMARTLQGRQGTLYRLDAQGVAKPIFGSVGVPNGLAFSPDGGTMYWADSLDGVIFAFDFDRADGAVRHRRVLVPSGVAPGFPDGAAVDEQGCLWSARWRGGCVARFTPDGALDRVIELPVNRVTACTFGDADLGTLYVTTASAGMDADAVAREPLAGGLFAIRPGVSGIPAWRYSG